MHQIIIGNTDGIGLGLTRQLLEDGCRVIGISRRDSSVKHENYEHHVCDVTDSSFITVLKDIVKKNGAPDLCVYCPGIGELLELDQMEREVEIVDVNLLGLIRTASAVIPAMVEKGSGHLIGISSLADAILSPEAPSYNASKAGFSNYLESLALGLDKKGVKVTNVRFGFVDTKMAKGPSKPLMMPVDKAVKHLKKCIRKQPARYTAPKILDPVIKLMRLIQRIQINFK